MKINEIIRQRRKALGLTQEQIAQRLGVSAPAVNKWESGQGYPEVEKLIQLSELLGVSLDELMKIHGMTMLLMIFHLRLRSRRNR